jgi:hypothetical protein
MVNYADFINFDDANVQFYIEGGRITELQRTSDRVQRNLLYAAGGALGSFVLLSLISFPLWLRRERPQPGVVE